MAKSVAGGTSRHTAEAESSSHEYPSSGEFDRISGSRQQFNWGERIMSCDLTDAEREFLQELLEARYTSMLHELHHTDSYQFRELLQQKITLLENLRQKIGQSVPTSAA